ncbi:MAG: hypothetical protein A2Z91_02205 [Deltaproteobacteria bacterium GWA2_38_16]|nr:MAG: hypothetical protein A2Z91_02205 [Deltaproteobacteria bacterium GWA2_38_16]OGQ02009.1 MAG: hypothetical protein A3D19_08500 [Deltaproteobacteria bacterium RIFCSPHIGHO2_02_FULL_38_15]OGQ61059.1 MAG: hypothetical protein A3G92_01970 [Deltaproteobacteria bacterium RIFCSPLOWO2_12_FULL_38_8]
MRGVMRGIRGFLFSIGIFAGLVFILSCAPQGSSSISSEDGDIIQNTTLSFPNAGCESTLKLIEFVQKYHVVALDSTRTVSLLKSAMQKIMVKGRIPTPYFIESVNKIPPYEIQYQNFRTENILFEFSEMSQFCSAVQSTAQELSVSKDLLFKGIFRYFVTSLDPHSFVLESLEQGYLKSGLGGMLRRDQDDNVTFFSSGNPFYMLPEENMVASWVSDTAVLHIEIIKFVEASGSSPSTAQQFKDLYQQFSKEKKILALVIDLRRSTGGDAFQVAALADLFLKRGGTLLMREKSGNGWLDYRREARSGNELSRIEEIPVMMLVSRYSASSAEMFSAAMKENHSAIVIGEKTFGKGTAQRTVKLTFDDTEESINKSYLTLSTLYLFSPKGIPIQLQGVEPDITVSDQDYLSKLRPDQLGEFNAASEGKRWVHALSSPQFSLNNQFQEPANTFMDGWKEKLKAYFERQEHQFRLNDLAHVF